MQTAVNNQVDIGGTHQAKENILFAIALSLIVLVAAYIRFRNLGDQGFWVDEILHVYAADGILSGRGPAFPSGDVYLRAADFTRIVAGSFWLFGESEFSARLPAVIASLLFLLVSAAWIARQFGLAASCVYALVLAIAPFEVEWSRLARFYSIFQALFVLATILLFRLLEPNDRPSVSHTSTLRSKVAANLGIDAAWLPLFALALVLSYRMHHITLTLGVGLALYAVTCYLLVLLGQIEERHPVLNKYGLWIVTGIGLMIVVALAFPDFLNNHLAQLQDPLPWAAYAPASKSFYRYFLEIEYSWIFFTYPIGLMLIYLRDKRLAVFLFSVTAGPVLFLSVLAEQKSYRYIYHLFPLLIIPACVFVAAVATYIWDRLTQVPDNRFQLVKSAGAVSILFACIGLFGPWMSETRALINHWPVADWKRLSQLAPYLADKNNILLATEQNAIAYYLDRKPDFYVKTEYDNIAGEWDAEYFQNVPPIRTSEDFLEAIDTDRRVFFASFRNRVSSPVYLTDEMRNILDSDFDLVDDGTEHNILIYRKKAAP